MLNYTHVQEVLKNDTLALAVFRALHDNPEGVTRDDLVKTIYVDTRPRAESTKHRAARKAIARLRIAGVVVLSHSGKSGYRLATENEIEQVRSFVAEQFRAAKARMKAAASVRKAYGLKDNLEFDILEVMA